MKASDWISVEDRLPEVTHNESFTEYSNDVLICLNGIEVVIAIFVHDKYHKHKYWLSSIGGYTYPIGIVTHWQPIVLPKKEKK